MKFLPEFFGRTITLSDHISRVYCAFTPQESAHRLMYLIDRFFFSESDMEMNSRVLTWPDRIVPVFDANDIVSLLLC